MAKIGNEVTDKRAALVQSSDKLEESRGITLGRIVMAQAEGRRCCAARSRERSTGVRPFSSSRGKVWLRWCGLAYPTGVA
jgi:hypothetical protein